MSQRFNISVPDDMLVELAKFDKICAAHDPRVSRSEMLLRLMVEFNNEDEDNVLSLSPKAAQELRNYTLRKAMDNMATRPEAFTADPTRPKLQQTLSDPDGLPEFLR